MSVRHALGKMSMVFVLVLLAVTSAAAQDPQFEAAVERNVVGLGEQFTLSFTLSNGGMGGGKNIQLPDLSQFHILAGPNQSSSMQFVNGAVSSSVTYSYILQPKQIGKFTIGAASIEVGGKTLKSTPVSIEIVKSATPPKKQPSQADNSPLQLVDKVFLKATVDKDRVLQGEQVNLVFRIYTQVTVANVGIEKAPTYTGFWGEEIEIPKEAQSTENFNGKRYRVGIIKRYALFPTQSGTLEISPMELRTVVQIQSPRSNDPFDAFFRDPFGRNVEYPVKSEAIKIKVDPLPPGAPEDFKGAIGQFAMSTSLDKKTTRTNEPISVKVAVSGTGNIKLLEAPAVEFPPDFEQYAPKISDNISRSGAKITGSKTFEFLLLPRYPGLKVIKPITFSYFDLSRHEYIRLRSPQMEINVEQGAATPPPLIAGSSREDVRLLSQDIRFIKTVTPSFARTGEKLYASALFVGLLLLPLAGLAGVLVYARQQQVAMKDQVGYRNRRAIRIAQRGLKQAEYLLREKSGSKGAPSTAQRTRFYSEVARALWKYLGDKLNIPQAEFSIEKATDELGHRSVDSGLISALKVLMEHCDMARFAPTSLELGAMQRIYEEAKRIIIEIERTLK